MINKHGQLSIAKFPKENDEYSIDTWESVALTLAKIAGKYTADHELINVASRPVILSKRFDREGTARISFMFDMSMTGSIDGEGGSYFDIVDALTI